jgi:hypothetical protein
VDMKLVTKPRDTSLIQLRFALAAAHIQKLNDQPRFQQSAPVVVELREATTEAQSIRISFSPEEDVLYILALAIRYQTGNNTGQWVEDKKWMPAGIVGSYFVPGRKG